MSKKNSAAGAAGAANAECRMQNAELEDGGVDGAADDTNAECRMQNAEVGDEGAVGAADAANAELGDEGAEVKDFEAELAAERDRYLRLAAEYDNFRKRSAKEREKMYSDAITDTVTRLLPVYDNIERALKMECADEAFYKGVEMTMTHLTEILESMGVVPIQAAGEPFDPNRHNAVMSIANPELGEKIVAEECQKGFMLGERVIRHSTVVVAN